MESSLYSIHLNSDYKDEAFVKQVFVMLPHNANKIIAKQREFRGNFATILHEYTENLFAPFKFVHAIVFNFECKIMRIVFLGSQRDDTLALIDRRPKHGPPVSLIMAIKTICFNTIS